MDRFAPGPVVTVKVKLLCDELRGGIDTVDLERVHLIIQSNMQHVNKLMGPTMLHSHPNHYPICIDRPPSTP